VARRLLFALPTWEASMNLATEARVTRAGDLRRVASDAPMLDYRTERDYARRVRAGDPEALAALLASHLRLVMSIAQRYTRHGVPLEDLIAEGNLGLVEAARRFDAEKGIRFSTYATWWIRAVIRRYTLANRRIVPAPSTRNGRRLISVLRETQRRLTAELGCVPSRERVASELGVSPDEVAMVEGALGGRDVPLTPSEGGPSFELVAEVASPEEQAAERELYARKVASVGAALERLDRRERTIVEKRLLEDEADTLADIGDSLGLSRERVRQLELRAKQKLRDALLEAVA
jgi:RNA polymerase sigma-32 factor